MKIFVAMTFISALFTSSMVMAQKNSAGKQDSVEHACNKEVKEKCKDKKGKEHGQCVSKEKQACHKKNGGK